MVWFGITSPGSSGVPMAVRNQRLKYEEAIVWVEDPARFDYVREIVRTEPFRQRPVRWEGKPGRLIGYGVLRADAPNTGGARSFERRVLYVKDYDRDSEPEGAYRTGAPVETVDPWTVIPRCCGLKTERMYGKEAMT
jgi:hypothetical protein